MWKVPLRGEQNGAVLQQDKEFYAGEYSTRITLPGVSSLHLDQFSAAVLPCRSWLCSLSLSLSLDASSIRYSPPSALSTILSSFSCFATLSRARALSLSLSHSLSLSLSLSLYLFPYAFAFFSSKRFGRQTSVVSSMKRMHFKSCRTMKIQRRQWYKQ